MEIRLPRNCVAAFQVSWCLWKSFTCNKVGAVEACLILRTLSFYLYKCKTTNSSGEQQKRIGSPRESSEDYCRVLNMKVRKCTHANTPPPPPPVQLFKKPEDWKVLWTWSVCSVLFCTSYPKCFLLDTHLAAFACNASQNVCGYSYKVVLKMRELN